MSLFPLPSTGVSELIPALKSEPEEVGERLYLSEVIVERLKSEEEQQLYADHEVKEDIVIGPTEVQRPALTLHPDPAPKPVAKRNDFDVAHLFRSRLKLTDVRNELQCRLCGKWSISAAELLQHRQTHAGDSTDSSLIQFEERGPADNGVSCCDVSRDASPPCPALGAEYDLSRALGCRVEVRDARDELLCSQCGEWSITAARLQRHRQTHATRVQPTHGRHPTPIHTQHTPKGFFCDICEKTFTHNGHLKDHLLVHSGVKPYSCEICNKSFNRSSHLKRHFLTHSNSRPFPCDICDKSFVRKAHLKRHIYTHSGDKPYCCNVCGNKFTRKDYLKTHELIHSGVKPFSCEICSKSFHQSSYFKKHLLTHRNLKLFACDICDKTFTCKTSLKRHIYIHSGYKPYCCNVCGKKFTRQSHLKSHELVHSGIKPYSCEICSHSFSQSSTLKTHLLTHSKLKLFACDICDDTFALKVYLTCHIIRVHSRVHGNNGIGT